MINSNGIAKGMKYLGKYDKTVFYGNPALKNGKPVFNLAMWNGQIPHQLYWDIDDQWKVRNTNDKVSTMSYNILASSFWIVQYII